MSDTLLDLNGEVKEDERHPDRAAELEMLLKTTIDQIIPFIRRADEEVSVHRSHSDIAASALVDYQGSKNLRKLLTATGTLTLAHAGSGPGGFSRVLSSLMDHSVNTSCPGFMDKLYSAPVPVGIVSDLILSVLNTNLHVYQVSPVLTLIEKHVTKSLAAMFGLNGPRAGGINVQGGSASNMTSIVVARNTLFPQTKTQGNYANGLNLVMLTSSHGHYSIEKAAQACGFGSASVIPVPVDAKTGAMLPDAFEKCILKARKEGKTPFYVNATAGTTVLGSFDPFAEISKIAKRHGLWMHVDGAWGGSFVFSERLRLEKLVGIELADSIAINPHKMMGVPVTCSFLLGKDMKQFHEANTLRAGYLFHDSDDETSESKDVDHCNGDMNGVSGHGEGMEWTEPDDQADLTLQCGRRGDSLKLFMAWQYYGTQGYAEKIENASYVATHMMKLVSSRACLLPVSQNPPPCLQVCFYYAPGLKLPFGEEAGQMKPPGWNNAGLHEKTVLLAKYNSRVTETVAKGLVKRGFMIDYAPALEGQETKGKFFRAVVNISTPIETVERLVDDIEQLGAQVVGEMAAEYYR